MKTFNIFLNRIKEQNGTAMLIGGAVIDEINSLPIKDWDIEIYGLELNQIEFILLDMGLISNMVGKSFGIIKTIMDDIDFDLSVPRLENKIGTGHKDFEVILNPNMTPTEAGRRRDLTINSMYKNLHTNVLIDPFNGLEDLKTGCIRATDNDTFKEDPLRVLRVMQLLARKGKFVHKDTIELCRNITGFEALPAERIFEEFKKLLLKSDKPSIGLEFLRACGWIKYFPALNNLIGCKQNPDWHPEGDVWNHTMLVLDNASKLKHLIKDETLRLQYMFGVLLHDTGKPSTTTSDLKSNGHDMAGEIPTLQFMNQLTNSSKFIEPIVKIVTLHMQPGSLTRGNAKESSWRRLNNKFRLDILGLMSKADSAGRTGYFLGDKHTPSELCNKYTSEFGITKTTALVTGRMMIGLGMKQGKELGIFLKACFQTQLDDSKLTAEQIIKINS